MILNNNILLWQSPMLNRETGNNANFAEKFSPPNGSSKGTSEVIRASDPILVLYAGKAALPKIRLSCIVSLSITWPPKTTTKKSILTSEMISQARSLYLKLPFITKNVQESVFLQAVKIFNCPLCSHSTGVRANLNKHIRQVHGDHRPHPCQFCGKNFKRKAHLDRHTESQHLPVIPQNWMNS